MEKVLEVGNIRIKASSAKDKQGRSGYFIAEADLRGNKNARYVAYKSKVSRHKKPVKESVVNEALKEMRQYVDGKLKVRPIDEFLKTL